METSRPNNIHSSIPLLKARLSQSWLNKYTLCFVFLAIKLIMFSMSLSSHLKSAEKYSVQSCDALQNSASQAMSIPHYSARALNKVVSKAVTELVKGLIAMLLLMVKAIQEILVFVVNMFISTYTCLVTLVVQGAVNLAVDVSTSVVSFVNDTLTAVVPEIENGLQGLSKGLNTAANAFVDLGNLISGKGDSEYQGEIDAISFKLDGLKNFAIPGEVTEKIESIKDKVPSFEEVQNSIEGIIRKPFQLVTKQMNDTLKAPVNITESLSVPDLKKADFCSSIDIPAIYAKLDKGLHTALTILVAFALIAAVAFVIPICWSEYRLWKYHNELHVENQVMLRATLKDTDTEDRESVQHFHTIVFDSSHKYAAYFRRKLGFGKEKQSRALSQWTVAYMLYPHALAVLAFGLVGLLAFALQMALLSGIKNGVEHLSQAGAALSTEVATTTAEEARLWVSNTNKALASQESNINDNLLGWITTSTGTINSTLHKFVDGMNEGIDKTFAGTPLHGAVEGVTKCLVTMKLLKVADAMSWVHDHAHVTFPRVDDDVVPESSVIQDKTDQKSNSFADGLNSVIEYIQKMLYLELWLSLACIGLWVMVSLGAATYALIQSFRLRQQRDGDCEKPAERGSFRPPNIAIPRAAMFTKNATAVVPTPASDPFAEYPVKTNKSSSWLFNLYSPGIKRSQP